ncbi:hypothetical protein Trydic_g6200 [Trypoxylus dichotomus]
MIIKGEARVDEKSIIVYEKTKRRERIPERKYPQAIVPGVWCKLLDDRSVPLVKYHLTVGERGGYKQGLELSQLFLMDWSSTQSR